MNSLWMRALLAVIFLGGIASTQSVEANPALQPLKDALAINDVEKSVELGEQAVKALASSAEAWKLLGHAYSRMAIKASIFTKLSWAGKGREAYEKAVSLEPKNVDIRFALVQFYMGAPSIAGGGKDKVKLQAQEFAKVDPAGGEVVYGLYESLQERHDVAHQHFEKAVALAPEQTRFREYLAQSYGERKDWDKAFKVMEDALAINADDFIAHVGFARVAAGSGQRLEEGLTKVDWAIAQQLPENQAAHDLLRQRARIKMKMLRYDDASADLQAALKLSPASMRTKAMIEELEKLKAAK